MIVLGIETATIEVGVGLCRDGQPLGSLVARPGLRHVETLHPAINAVVAAAGITMQQIDAIAIDIGPGLFTGLRVGIAAAKGLAFGLKIPTIAWRSTDILIQQSSLSSLTVVPIIDMRRGEIAWAMPDTREIQLGSPQELKESLATVHDQLLLVGDGALRYADQIVDDSTTRFHFGQAPYDAPSAATLAKMGYERLLSGDTVDPFELSALYLRDADAKVNFAMRDEIGTN